MPRPHRPDRERIRPPVTEYLWLRLLEVITDDSERQLRDSPDPEIRAQYNATASFDFLLEGFDGVSEEAFARALDAYVAEHPGQRPSWWWQYHAPEPRRQVSGRMIRRFVEPAKHLPTDPDWNTWRNGAPGQGYWIEEPDPNDPPMQESQAAYLRRHKLLTPGEARRLKPADFKRVETAGSR